jgi:methylmalonyl-CoA mutase C-terminal domain/subunit
MIVEAALQEDADAIGISILSGAHMTIFRKILDVMQAKSLENVLLFGGGIIPKEDIEKLKGLGVGELFTPGTPTQETIEYVKKWVKEHRPLEV